MLSQAVVQGAQLEEGGAVVVAEPRGGGQVLDGLLGVPQPDVAVGPQLPRLGVPGGDLTGGRGTGGLEQSAEHASLEIQIMSSRLSRDM